METFVEEFAGFLKSEEAQKVINLYFRGYITYIEAIKMLEQVRDDAKHLYIVRCKEEKRGSRWRDYSGSNLTRAKAEEYAAELNNGEYGEHKSVNGNRIIFKAFQIA